MSDSEVKEKRSRRLKKEENVIRKQMKIAKQHGLDPLEVEREPHRFAKHHAMDCGVSGCAICSSPRRSGKHGKTIQEYSFEQTEKWTTE